MSVTILLLRTRLIKGSVTLHILQGLLDLLSFYLIRQYSKQLTVVTIKQHERGPHMRMAGFAKDANKQLLTSEKSWVEKLFAVKALRNKWSLVFFGKTGHLATIPPEKSTGCVSISLSLNVHQSVSWCRSGTQVVSLKRREDEVLPWHTSVAIMRWNNEKGTFVLT